MQTQDPSEPQGQRGGSDKETLPGVVGVGTRLDWNSPIKNIALCVELPFWLLMSATTLRVSVGDFTTDVVIDNDGIEIQHGRQFTRTHRNTAFIGGKQAAAKASIPMMAIPDGGLFRGTRTLLYINTYAMEDALNAFFSEDRPRFQDGYRYFASLALAHLPVVNKVINAYRMAAVDPFANEVTAWDVPVWFVCHSIGSESVCLYSHLVEDWYPTIRKGLQGKDDVPYVAATVESVEQQLTKGEIPGEIEMLDGWSLFHRGRFGDSIRSFVTAIEVLLEAEIRRLLAQIGESQHVIDSQVDSTRNNFDKRLEDYCKLSKRRVPGPILHYIPYINGVRLTEELDRTRKLRHKIVHHGHRLDHTFSKPMLRAAETTSWLFDWLLNSGDFEKRRMKNSTFFFGLRTSSLPFECEVRDGRIVVLPIFTPAKASDEPGEDAIVIDSINRVVHNERVLLRAISRERSDGKDVEHFVKMAFYELGVGELDDSPFESSSHPIPERFRMHYGGRSIPVFVLDTTDTVASTHVNDVRKYLLETKEKNEVMDHAILVANDQNGCEWCIRYTNLDVALEKLASEQKIAVVTTSDLARLVLGAMKYNWSLAAIVGGMLRSGVFQSSPPASRYLGNVYHYWSHSNVIGVQLAESIEVKSGDVVAIRLRKTFHQVELSDANVDSAGRLTFKIDLGRSDVPIGSPVYLLDLQSSFRVEANNAEDGLEVFGKIFAGRVVHPTREADVPRTRVEPTLEE